MWLDPVVPRSGRSPALARLKRRAPLGLRKRWWRTRDAAQALALALRADPAARTPGTGALRDEGAPATERLHDRLSSDVLARVDAHLRRDSAVVEVPDS